VHAAPEQQAVQQAVQAVQAVHAAAEQQAVQQAQQQASVLPMTDGDSSDDRGSTKPARGHPPSCPREHRQGEDSDADLVKDVRLFMKTNKLSQVTVGQEARISQAVMSQWLSLKYYGHNDKVWTSAGSPMAAASECVLLAVAS
jgi:hypothetical protein